MRRSLALAVPVLAAAAAAAAGPGYGFGGFSPDGLQFLKHGADDRVCTVALPTTCQPIDRKAGKAAGFAKPARTRKVGATTVEVMVEDGSVVLRSGDTVLGRYRPPATAAVSANANVFVAPDESAVAVEFEGQAKIADVIVFPIQPRQPAPPPTSPRPPAPPSGGGNAYDRAMAKGGMWEQRMVPCDQAGVRLTLKKTRTFELRVDTRCQADKDSTQVAGKWSSEGPDKLELTFENENGPTEALPCRLAACVEATGGETEDCLSCSDPDISFVLKVVRR